MKKFLNHSLKFKFGLSAILRNPLRIIVSLLTAIVAFGIVGMCVFTYTYDIVVWEKDIFLNYSDDPYVNMVYTYGRIYGELGDVWAPSEELTYEKYHELLDKVEGLGDNYAVTYQTSEGGVFGEAISLGVSRINKFLGQRGDNESEAIYCEYNGERLFAPYVSPKYESLNGKLLLGSSAYDLLYSLITIYSGEEAMDEFGYTLVGRLPEKYNEIAIPQWLYNSFLCYGYRNPDTGEVTKISSEEDIIGKRLWLTGDSYYARDEKYIKIDGVITGVIHVDYASDPMVNHMKISEDNKTIAFSFDYSIPPHLGLAVSEDFFETYRRRDEGGYIGCVTVSRSSENIEKYFDYLTEWKRGLSFYDIIDVDRLSKLHLNYVMPMSINGLYTSLPEVFNAATIYFKIVPFLTPFAFVLLTYFAVSTVYGRRREIGIFRSMGMSKTKIWLSFLIPLAVAAIITSIAATAVELGFMGYMNAFLYRKAESPMMVGFYPFTLNAPTLLLTFLSPILTVTISSAVALFFLTRKSVCSLIAK